MSSPTKTGGTEVLQMFSLSLMEAPGGQKGPLVLMALNEVDLLGCR